MLTIIKKNGQREEFCVNKIKSSLAASSDEAKQPLNESDLTSILHELQQILDGKTTVSTQQITVIIAGLLYLKGFIGVLQVYLGYKNK